MKLKKFHAEKVHGFLTLDVDFFEDLTFLTGINGSGKTTVIYSIVALITPNLQILANVSFANMKLTIEHEGKDIEISAVKDSIAITISISGTQEAFAFPIYAPDPDEAFYKNSERESEFYKNLTLTQAKNAVLALINSLPTPMFLDLDRRARMTSDRLPARERVHFRTLRRGRNVFSVSLMQSLIDAAALAESNYSELQIRLRRLGETSRTKLILSLLELQPLSYGGAVEKPTAQDISTLQAVKKAAVRLPELLQLPESEISSRLTPFLEQLSTFANDIPNDASLQTILAQQPQNQKVLNALVGWSANRQQLNKISEMMEYVTTFNKESDSLSGSVTDYRNMVNRFLADSGKTIFFDESGWLSFRVKGLKEPQPVTSLSSGEAQIFVILTHLAFNPAAQEANVFIVDEPELSLHVQWQEIFVESVRSANPNVQYIMATHAPSIILDRIDNCRDLTAVRAQP